MHEVQQLAGTVVHLVFVAHAVCARGIEELLPDVDDRVERRERCLKHHRAIGPAETTKSFRVEGEDVKRPFPVVVPDLAFRDASAPRRKADQANGERRLAGPRLADDGDRLTLFEVKGHIAHRLHRAAPGAVLDRKVAH